MTYETKHNQGKNRLYSGHLELYKDSRGMNVLVRVSTRRYFTSGYGGGVLETKRYSALENY